MVTTFSVLSIQYLYYREEKIEFLNTVDTISSDQQNSLISKHMRRRLFIYQTNLDPSIKFDVITFFEYLIIICKQNTSSNILNYFFSSISFQNCIF